MINKYYYKWNIENWTNGNKPVKNPDLWEKLIEQLAIHKVNFSFAETNQYTSYIELMFKRLEIEYKEDKHGE
jgi:ribonuclease HI